MFVLGRKEWKNEKIIIIYLCCEPVNRPFTQNLGQILKNIAGYAPITYFSANWVGTAHSLKLIEE